MIYFALRNHNWETVPLHVENEIIEIDADRFVITYDSFNTDGGIPVIEWKTRISGMPDGSVDFEITGRVVTEFRRNRAGFCLLHPPELAGTPCQLVHDSGTQSTVDFPIDVSPVNLFKDVRSMTWSTGGNSFTVEFEGDVFEMEDQRNWGDASYKTFCTPLEKPFPVTLKKGEKIFQAIKIRPMAKIASTGARREGVELRPGAVGTLPRIGIGTSTEVSTLSPEVVILLKSLRLSHYRVDIYPGSERFAAELSQHYENAYTLGLPLEAVVHLTDKFPEELEAFSVICQQNKVRLKQVLLLKEGSATTPQELIDEVSSLKSVFPRVQFGAGTDYNFNELNKNRFDASNVDFVCFSMDPQEHAYDDLTILENSGSLPYLIRSARSIYGESIDVHISPLTLRRRYNPYATVPEDVYIDEVLRADPRQKEKFAALWTFCSLVNLAKGNADSVTLYQTVGNQGVIGSNGVPYPVYDVIKLLAPYQGKSVEFLESSNPHAVTAAIVDKRILMMINLTDQEQTARLGEQEYRLPPGEVRTETI